ncbi:MAG: response regulator [Thermodesulfovibrionales bacterium]|nr:response regulator [Thermodesulfovibrionales bacterium]
MQKKVLVIDDEPFILMMIEDKFSRAGIQVVTSKVSVGAVELIERERPDLIILDWMLPEISGLEICRQLMENEELAKIPVFMLSAKGQSEDRNRGLHHGVKKYITKPFSPKVLLSIVLEELNNK